MEERRQEKSKIKKDREQEIIFKRKSFKTLVEGATATIASKSEDPTSLQARTLTILESGLYSTKVIQYKGHTGQKSYRTKVM